MSQFSANIPVTAKFPAFIVSVQGTNPGPASGITYTLDINMPNSGPLRVAGVAPANNRPPESIDTQAVAPNTFCEVWFIGGRIHACIYEFPAWGACT